MDHSETWYIPYLCVIAIGIIIVSFSVFLHQLPEPEPEPIESTRRVIINCTVKSNIDGVITLNDECDITVIGEN